MSKRLAHRLLRLGAQTVQDDTERPVGRVATAGQAFRCRAADDKVQDVGDVETGPHLPGLLGAPQQGVEHLEEVAPKGLGRHERHAGVCLERVAQRVVEGHLLHEMAEVGWNTSAGSRSPTSVFARSTNCSIRPRSTASNSASLVGKCRYTVATPTPTSPSDARTR